jgi:hypothetical protein
MLRSVTVCSVAFFSLLASVGCETDKAKIGATIDKTGNMAVVFRLSCKPSAKVFRVQLISYDQGKRIVWDISSESGSLDRLFTVGSVPSGFSETIPYVEEGMSYLQFRIESDSVKVQESFTRARLAVGKVFVRGDVISLEEFAKRDTCP